ncbi:RNA-directed DNA polymerase [Kineosporia sp. J2-2]|uniref:RNA-directed DNA polymerase n=1 Tax=Kineosporia corallincola TaxID=2835133 RepID=A0ABS5TFR7_9ACTN|nr:reverse transcriptase family protein [Kineosporia corallincola]MBT0769940.1 RNA-directed DNA polymerase [Kineosporia corallincola]
MPRSAPRCYARALHDRSHPDATVMTSDRVRTLARGLGNAFLGAEAWATRPMAEAAVSVVGVGGRRRWPRKLAREVLAAYPRPPADRPRELARFIENSPVLWAALNRSAPPGRAPVLRARRIPPTPVRMADRRPWPVPELHDLADLAALLDLDPAHLDWFADVKGLQRRAAPGPLHHYRYRWTTPGSGRPRLLEAPRPRLRSVQRTLLDEVLALIPVHPAAHGFVPGRSAVTGARRHTGAAVVISLDLAAFFAHLNGGRVYGVFRTAGYAQPVAHALTGLCVHRTPVAVIAAMPPARPGSTPEAVSARPGLRRLLAGAHLPQGAPTSPALANLCVMALDRRLSGLAAATGLTYTRYADDLTFSGDLEPRAAQRVTEAVGRIVRSEGLALQPAKTRVRERSRRQEVTGIVVNEHSNLPRTEYDRLRAILHNAARSDPAVQNREQHADFRAHLLGRIAWATQLNPARGQKLRAQFERIVWPGEQP